MQSRKFIKKLFQLAKTTSASPINPEDREEYVIDDCVAFEMEPINTKWVHFISIRSVKPGKGNGAQALGKVMALADSTETYLLGRVIPYDTKILPKSKLQAWYREYGCNPLDEKDPDGLWIRIPKGAPYELPKLCLRDKIKVYRGLSGEDYKAHWKLSVAVASLFALWLIKKS